MDTNKFAFIFDMDGVIVDNAECHYHAWEEFCRRKGYNYQRADSRYWFGNTNREILEKIMDRKPSPEEIRELGEEKEAIYRELIAPDLRPVEGLEALLKAMNTSGFSVAMATSAPIENVDFVLGRLGIRHYFDPIVDASGVENGKPSPEIYLKAARLVGREPANCLVFEDAIAGIRSARNAGMKVVGLVTTLEEEELEDTELNISDFRQTSLEQLYGILSGDF
ncbi:MAG: HAD family phosphatase [Bacteroidales bacterium]|nr:HAD family phosphatase [Bacteroidales bacterium]MDT8432314.1 HAD family phosphatase [Bacteroidales bacterium]